MKNHVPNYLLDTKELLVSLVNYDNATYYEVGEVQFGKMIPITGEKRDTSIALSFTKPPLNRTPKIYKYDRIRLDVIFNKVLLDTTRYGYVETITDYHGDLVPSKAMVYIEKNYKINTRVLDIDFEITSTDKPYLGITLSALPSNISYVGSVFIPLLPKLIHRVVNTDLSIGVDLIKINEV